jgi:hypothetical protein
MQVISANRKPGVEQAAISFYQHRAGSHFFLSTNAGIPPNNGAILNIAHIIKHVMSSATEAELAALYIMAREVVYIRIILEEMGHKQPPQRQFKQTMRRRTQ